jgi:hypothetical protein
VLDPLVQGDKGRTVVVGVVEMLVVADVVLAAAVELVVVAVVMVVEEFPVHKPGLAPMLKTASMTGQTPWYLIVRSFLFSPQ